MARLDRYMLSQLLLLFGFFALVLVALFWINRAVILFDRLIGDGQSALVFLEFTALGLPKLITTVLPIAAFAGAVQRGMGIECDIQRSRDDAAMLVHDWELERLTGNKQF